MAKKRQYKDVAVVYSTKLCDEFYDHCCKGLDLAQIAHTMVIPQETLLKWAKDERKKEFGRTFIAGKTACQAYHSNLLDDMIQANKTAAAALQLKRLQTLFPDDWNVAAKQEIKVEDPYNQLTPEELDKRINALLRRESVERRRAIIKHAKKEINDDEQSIERAEDSDAQAS